MKLTALSGFSYQQLFGIFCLTKFVMLLLWNQSNLWGYSPLKKHSEYNKFDKFAITGWLKGAPKLKHQLEFGILCPEW